MNDTAAVSSVANEPSEPGGGRWRHVSCSRMRTAVRAIDCLLLVALVLCNIQEAFADDRTAEDAGRDAARQHYGRGLELANQGKFSEAILEFQEAYRNRPHFAALYNIGQAYIALQQPIEAIAALEQYLAQGQEQIPVERAQATVAQIAAERAQTAEIRLTARPTGANVSIDGKPVGDAPLGEPIRVAAGRHLISVRTPDGTEVARELAPQGGERITLIIEIPSAATTSRTPRSAPAAGSAQPPAKTISVMNRQGFHYSPDSGVSIHGGTLGYVLGSVGAALGAGAVGHYFWNRNRYAHWQSTHSELANNQQAADYTRQQFQNNELAGSIKSASQVSVGLAVVGGLLLTTGITLVILDRGNRPKVTAESQAGGALLSLRSAW
jgi:tetratricopeptide (TPR) repeat protein